ncbi:sensor histidine kinase [Rubellimicrobium aerolatum]|uniref:histidine kinase n=1 Tax=Rubellimicrobium aerolatum TaxID=490979 RepID=A0ABW0SER0_9RHOB|nr:signal transduction histidine kinase [Rubellimicrobium aerolatum]
MSPIPRRSVLRSTPLRLALGLVALFATTSLVSLAGSYWLTRTAILSALEADLGTAVAGLAATPDAEALAATIAAQVQATDPDRQLLSFVDAQGASVGNAASPGTWLGLRTLTMDETVTGHDGTFLALARPLHGGRLMVALGGEQLGDLREVFLNVLLLSLLPTIGLGLAGGLVLARREGRRVEAIAATLDRLAEGDLAARVPAPVGRPSRAADDLALIAARIDRMAGAQEASVAALRQVSADIAHDLRTPVSRIRLLLGDLLARLPEAGEEARIAGRAVEEADRAAAIFGALLQIAQVEAGTLRERFAPVDLQALAATVADIYGPVAEDGGHDLRLRLDPAPITVRGEKGLLQQAVANLVDNALRHTPPGSRIVLSVEVSQGRAEVAVADDGPGVPTAERDAVLRRFTRLERSRTTEGHGLGLSLVAAVAALHEAELTLEDNDPGLRVRLIFPAG